MCRSNNIRVWPDTGVISVNSVFVIQGYMESQDVIRQLNFKYKIYLKTGELLVPLRMTSIYEGQYNYTQAILKPEGLLKEGALYYLHIDSLEKYEKNDFYGDNFHWTVSKKPDIKAPVWTGQPVFISKQKIAYGCGPAVYASFCTGISDESPVLVFTRVKELKTGRTGEYFLEPYKCILNVGHGMCGGAFTFQDRKRYEISFSLMDASGNRDSILTDALVFTSPGDKDNGYVIKNCNCGNTVIKENIWPLIFACLLIILLAIILVLNIKWLKFNSSHRPFNQRGLQILRFYPKAP